MAMVNIIVDPGPVVAGGDVAELAEWLSGIMERPIDIPPQPTFTGAELSAILSPLLSASPDHRAHWTYPSDTMDRAPVRSIRRPDTPTLAANLIVRDGLSRGADVVRAVRSVAPICSEIVIHDTGSVDGTLEALRALAPELPCERVEIRKMNWPNDFGAARNRVLLDTTAEHVLWIDDDEEWAIEACEQTVLALHWDLDHGAPCAYQLARIGPGFGAPIWRTFVFPRLPGVHWDSALHEHIESSLDALDIPHKKFSAPIWHHSFSDLDHLQYDADRDDRMTKLHPEVAGLGWHGDGSGIWVVGVLDGDIRILEADQKAVPTVHAPPIAGDLLNAAPDIKALLAVVDAEIGEATTGDQIDFPFDGIG